MLQKKIGKLICKIANKLYDKALLAKMLAFSVEDVDSSEAISRLSRIAEDSGDTCLGGCRVQNRECLLSVIVPAYNVEQYIDRCLESILRQEISFEYEIIVVNDGSTDGTAKCLEKYRKNQCVILIEQYNKGLSSARNTGLDHAKGEYVYFVDSDDELPDGAMESLMKTAIKNNAMMVVGSYVRCDRHGRVKRVIQLEDKKAGGDSLPGFPWGKLIHYSVFEKLRFPEGYWFEDSIMAQIVHPLCKDSTYTSSCVAYKYYVNDAGITATAKGRPKSIDSLWITMRLLDERARFGLEYTQDSYEYFLSMVNLTYQRTKYLGSKVAQCIFAVQRMLLNRYYDQFRVDAGFDMKKYQIQEALRSNHFKKYILACERKK